MTSAPAPHAQVHIDAILALLAAGAVEAVYDWGEVPGRLAADGSANPGVTPFQYALVAVSRRFVENTRLVALPSRSGWRISVLSVGRSAYEVRALQHAVAMALESKRLSVSGHTSSPVLIETPGLPEPDDGAMSALDTFTYAL